MKHKLTSPVTPAQLLTPRYIHHTFTFLCMFLLSSVVHSRASLGAEPDLIHQQVVEEFKSRVLQHMGRTTPPRGYNASRHSLDGKLIRDFLRKRFSKSQQSDSIYLRDKYADSKQDNLQTFVFPSTDSELRVPVPATAPSPASSLTTVKFSTNLQQPEVPYQDLLIKSAILRMRISRQKRKLHDKNSSALNVNVFLLRKGNQKHRDNLSKLIHSTTVDTPKLKDIEIHLNSQLLSHLFESDDKTLTIGVQVEMVPKDNNGGRSVGNTRRSKLKKLYALRNSQNEELRVSKARLHMTTAKKDLRKSRIKRQNQEGLTCPDDLCCRHSIYVDFAEIGWSDWVLYPAGYTAYYCKGGCPDRYRVASSFTSIKSILHEMFPSEVPDPVCAPTGYDPLDFIIFDGEIKEMAYPGMIVTGCRCN